MRPADQIVNLPEKFGRKTERNGRLSHLAVLHVLHVLQRIYLTPCATVSPHGSSSLWTEGAMCRVHYPDPVEFGMVQKIIDVAGSSPTSFAKAADNAVATAAETVRNLKWARVSELEMELDGKKVKSYRVTVRIYFDVER